MPIRYEKKLTMTIICPGCGWLGTVDKLCLGACPECEYENGAPPYRLLTLGEMLRITDIEYINVRMDLFLASLFKLMRTRKEPMLTKNRR